MGERDRILREGRNYWRRARADRASFLVDAADYFAAFRAAALRAERSIVIIGWDIHSRMRLVPGVPEDGFPAELGAFLNALIARRPRLRVHILVWDFPVIYAVEREVMPLFSRGWTSHRRMIYRLDSVHPLGASQHQKIVLIDDRLAFVGGIDLTMRRWDTSEHRPLDPRRVDPDGVPYAPFHDIQMAIDGPAAAAIAELARERWRRGTGRRLRPARNDADPWPLELAVHLRDAPVAIARTVPAFGGRPEVREVQRLWEDAIAAARRSIYVEQQYFTAANVADALARRLQEADGPDIVIVLPRHAHGWLEQAVLADAQARLIRRLRLADVHGRLRLYYPVLAGDGPEAERWVRIHAKVLVVGDSLVRIGSSNTSNRSMGVDSECDLVIEADGPVAAAAIAGFRNRLIAEHLGCAPQEVAAALATAPLIAAIESLSRPDGRRFAPVEAELPPDPLGLHRDDAPEANPFDPERPIRPERFIDDFLPEAPPPHRISRRMLSGLAWLAAILGLVGLWAFTPFREEVTVVALLDHVAAARGTLWMPLWVTAAFVFGNLLLVPVMLLIAVSGLAFGPLLGFFYAALGSFASASVGFALGRWVGRDLVRRLAGRQLNRISRRLARSGIPTVAALRVLPIAPFALVNMVAGAMHLHYRDYILGTALGMLPGIVAMTVLGATVERILRGGDWASVALFVLVLGGLLGAGFAFQRWLGRRATAPLAASPGE